MEIIKERLFTAIKTAYVVGIKERRDVGTSKLIKELASEKCEEIVEDVAIKFANYKERLHLNKMQMNLLNMSDKQLFELFKKENNL